MHVKGITCTRNVITCAREVIAHVKLLRAHVEDIFFHHVPLGVPYSSALLVIRHKVSRHEGVPEHVTHWYTHQSTKICNFTKKESHLIEF